MKFLYTDHRLSQRVHNLRVGTRGTMGMKLDHFIEQSWLPWSFYQSHRRGQTCADAGVLNATSIILTITLTNDMNMLQYRANNEK